MNTSLIKLTCSLNLFCPDSLWLSVTPTSRWILTTQYMLKPRNRASLWRTQKVETSKAYVGLVWYHLFPLVLSQLIKRLWPAFLFLMGMSFPSSHILSTFKADRPLPFITPGAENWVHSSSQWSDEWVKMGKQANLHSCYISKQT